VEGYETCLVVSPWIKSLKKYQDFLDNNQNKLLTQLLALREAQETLFFLNISWVSRPNFWNCWELLNCWDCLKTKQSGCLTILSLTIHFDVVRLDFGLHSIKLNIALIEHNCCPDLVWFMLCWQLVSNIAFVKLNQGGDYVWLILISTILYLSNKTLIEHNCCPDLVQLMLCSTLEIQL